MKILLLILMLFSFSNAGSIDSLLQDYEKESELSNKTKDESAGNLIVYTRDDLERMQVESLNDILKSLRLFAYTENRLGQPDILNQDPMIYYSSSVRVYLNETELLTAMTGSGLIFFGNMEMDFIDHIEIYQGFPSFDFGVEPSTVVIRLYSKTAEHDEGGRVKATLSTNGANKENVYYTNIEDGISYFIYANRTDDKKDTYEHDGQTLRHDTQTSRFYGSVGVENHTFDFHLMKIEGDAFLGAFTGNIPNSTSRENIFANLSTNSKFMNDSLTLNLSYIKLKNKFSNKYDTGQGPYIGLPIGGITSYIQEQEENSFTASIKKEWEIDTHTLSIGAQYRYKNFDIETPLVNGSSNDTFQLPDLFEQEDIYSIFIQDLISLNENHLLSLSVMDQLYTRDKDIGNQNTLQLRLGYIYTDEKWVSKTFISSQEFSTEPYLLMSNKNLEESVYTSILQEVSYQTPQTLSKIILGYGISENMIIPTSSGVDNSNIDATLYTAIGEFTYYFSKKDKLEIQVNFWSIESPVDQTEDNTEHTSYIARMLNSVSNFDIFNEIIIHTGYTDIDSSFDYTAGIKYQVNKDFHLNIKGENIFDNSLDADYYNQLPPVDTLDKVIVPTIERRFTLGMEYLF